MILAQTPNSLDGAVDLIQLGFVGIALLWFVLGKVYPASTVNNLQAQIAELNKIIAEERQDAKTVRDAVIRDVAPMMARVADRDKEVVELVTKLLVWATSQDGKK